MSSKSIAGAAPMGSCSTVASFKGYLTYDNYKCSGTSDQSSITQKARSRKLEAESRTQRPKMEGSKR